MTKILSSALILAATVGSVMASDWSNNIEISSPSKHP